jgi:ribosomal protein S18 acetylase RimI-like enzyme
MSPEGQSMPNGYALVPGTPSVEDYLRLRLDSGLSPKTREQAEAALPGGWAAVHAVQTASGETVGMARLLGDGGWYFHVVDVAVSPAHQRRGLGDRMLTHLLELTRASVPPGAYVSLMADAPGRRLYARHGFRDSAPHSVGMTLLL